MQIIARLIRWLKAQFLSFKAGFRFSRRWLRLVSSVASLLRLVRMDNWFVLCLGRNRRSVIRRSTASVDDQEVAIRPTNDQQTPSCVQPQTPPVTFSLLVQEREHDAVPIHALNVPEGSSSTCLSYIHDYSSHVSLPESSSDIPRTTASPVQDNVATPSGDVVLRKSWCSFAHPKIHPVVPEYTSRYEPKVIIPRDVTNCVIPPFALTTSPCDISGWISCCHPEGALYFFHKQKKIYTDANLRDPGIFERISADVDAIEEFHRDQGISRSLGVDLVLDLVPQDGGSPTTYYYFADHGKRCIYYLDEFNASKLPTWDIKGVKSLEHVRYELEYQYWYGILYCDSRVHCELYPKSLKLTNDIVHEFRDILVHALSDLTFSPTSTIPFDVGELQTFINLTDQVEKNIDTPFTEGAVRFVASSMQNFLRQKYYGFHGQPGARLNRDQSIYGTKTRRTWLIRVLSPMLFYAPEVHLRSLDSIWVDEIIIGPVWNQFLGKLNAEWQEFVLYATVLLNANVAFLAIQSVDEDPPHRSAAQIASYISILASIGSVILGLLLIRQNRTKARDNPTDASMLMYKHGSGVFGLETLAIMFSLPYAMLMWGMTSFLVAFIFMCFDDANVSTRSLIGVTLIAVFVLIMWCIRMFWEHHHEVKGDGEDSDPPAVTDDLSASTRPHDKVEPTRSSHPLKRLWRWPSLVFRRPTYDSEKTVV